MEELEITGSKKISNNDGFISDLARNLRVEIGIELSRIPMTLKEICELRPGEIIDLRRKIEDPLEIVLDGKIIGFCSPVQIDGRLGIKIISLENDAIPTEEV